jgi:hypothetical protein
MDILALVLLQVMEESMSFNMLSKMLNITYAFDNKQDSFTYLIIPKIMMIIYPQLVLMAQ